MLESERPTLCGRKQPTNKNFLYDSYIKAFRWATDRLDSRDGGVIAFITNSGWIHKDVFNGFRESLADEFSSIYMLDLRGGIRGRSGDLSKREGQNIFDIMTGVAVVVLVKSPEKDSPADIQYIDIGDYLSKNEKLRKLVDACKLDGPKLVGQKITPNEHNDWILQRTEGFSEYNSIEPERKFDSNSKAVFSTYSCGVQTNRDNWVYGFSRPELGSRISELIEFYNKHLEEWRRAKKKDPELEITTFIETDETKIKWAPSLIDHFAKFNSLIFDESLIETALYRPFVKANLYRDNRLNHRPYQTRRLFPTSKHANLLICVPGTGFRKEFGVLITNTIPDLEIVEKSQCFPLYYYDQNDLGAPTLFDRASEPQFIRRDGITDWILKQAHERYGKEITREDIFYFVYGFLHNPEYRTKFANDLRLMLPRIPLLESKADFVAFSKAGRSLAQLHLNYEKISAYPDLVVTGEDSANFRVGKMRFIDKETKDAIQYNSDIVVSNIPAKAYEYVVNGKSAIEWIMERYQVKTDKASGITNDPNHWSDEVGDERYILDLLLSIVNVSVQTVDIVNDLPKVKFE